MSNKEIDYLYEDPEIPGQRFGLVSIVGPNMPQKCDVWGLKIRGVADNLEKAKKMTQKLMKIDKEYDIYTVEIGKFFPLVVNPFEINDIEYQNSQLNELIKGYLESKELANDQWEEQKNEMVKQAIMEGKTQTEKPEHPIAVWQRVCNLKEQMKTLQEQLIKTQNELDNAEEKFESYTEEEKEEAKNFNQEPKNEIDSTLEQLNKIDNRLKDLEETKNKNGTSEDLEMINKQLSELNVEKQELVKHLQDKNKINDYINSNYTNSEYSNLDSNVREI
jgi:DNA repair exonuclease SbcCD ATPase subunit